MNNPQEAVDGSSYGESIAKPARSCIDAFKKAVSNGAEVIECQVRSSLDHILVLSETSRFDGMKIKDTPYWLLSIDEPLETLTELFEELPDDLTINVELKQPGLVKNLLATEHKQKIVVTSMSPRYLMEAFHEDLLLELGLKLGADFDTEFDQNGVSADTLAAAIDHMNISWVLPHASLLEDENFWDAIPDSALVCPWDVDNLKAVEDILEHRSNEGFVFESEQPIGDDNEAIADVPDTASFDDHEVFAEKPDDLSSAEDNLPVEAMDGGMNFGEVVFLPFKDE